MNLTNKNDTFKLGESREKQLTVLVTAMKLIRANIKEDLGGSKSFNKICSF